MPNLAKISVVIHTTYTDKRKIKKTIDHITNNLQKLTFKLNFEYEIIIIIFNKKLNKITLNNLKDLQHTSPNVKIINKSYSKTTALKTGVLSASGDIIIQDIDLEHISINYGDLIVPILQNKTKVVFKEQSLKATKGQSHTTVLNIF